MAVTAALSVPALHPYSHYSLQHHSAVLPATAELHTSASPSHSHSDSDSPSSHPAAQSTAAVHRCYYTAAGVPHTVRLDAVGIVVGVGSTDFAVRKR